MGYYVTVLGTKDVDISVAALQRGIGSWRWITRFEESCEQQSGRWDTIDVSVCNGAIPVTQICRDTFSDQAFFLEMAVEAVPASASQWLQRILPSIMVVYSFQLLYGGRTGPGWWLWSRLISTVQQQTRGIIHADNEGFANHYGDRITWDFSERVAGHESMAVLAPDGRWHRFRMDLGNPVHRDAFSRGEVPAGVKYQVLP